ncbi:MAG: HPr family phosphocarrier protein [Actinomycetota bacterium]|nr:HPr family phosphocarrier protein [Actinomycetota bacterium]
MSPSSERTVLLPADLHARPAGQLSRVAAGFGSRPITLIAGGKEVDARSVLLVMQLGATKGTEVTVRAVGDDAEQAVETLAGMLAAVTPVDASA